MRKIADLFLLFFFFFFLFWQKDKVAANFNYLLASPCDRPITFRLGEIDRGYGLTTEQFLGKTEEAGQIWSKVVSKNLFTYDPKAKITVNLIYSERQSMADNLDQLEQTLKGGKQSVGQMEAEYKSLSTDFTKQLAVFNHDVELWNSQGGAPPEVFARLVKQKEELQGQADKLNNLARKLNLSVQNYNLDVGKFNQSAQNFKQAITVKPEAGLYDGTIPKIDIYLTSSQKELVHTLAHEMGHALGLSHFDNQQSIMYPFTNEVVQPDSQEATQLRNYCGQRNLDLILERLSEILKEESKKLK